MISKDTQECLDIDCKINNCIQCDISGRCTDCDDGYAVRNGSCVACSVESC